MRKRLRTVMVSIGLMILLAQPAFAEELGQANITPRTKMAEIRSNPSIVGAGIYTYSLDQDRVLDRMYWDAQPLSRLSNHWTAQDAADGLNYLIRTYNAGQRVTFPLYTAEEIAQDTSRDGVELYYLPAEGAQANQKYALVIGGNAIVVSAEIREGISTAWNLHEMGYPVFVLRYRIGMKASNNAPLQDVVRAVQYITEHAGQFWRAGGGLCHCKLFLRRADRRTVRHRRGGLQKLRPAKARCHAAGLPGKHLSGVQTGL